MKKLIIFFSVLALPLTAMAQDKSTKMSNKVIDAAIDKFVPLVCKKGLNEALIEVQKCYKNTPATYPEIEQCLVADSFVSFIMNIKNNNDIENHTSIRYPTPYINVNQYVQRLEKYRKEIPQYQQYSRSDFRKYVSQSIDDLLEERALMQHDKSNHCIED